MYEPRSKVLWFAVASRITVLILQFLFNILCPDHDAGVFKSPVDDLEKVSVYDTVVKLVLNGLTRWDGEYYLHIAKYGYTYENSLAFYPLYPVLIRIVAGFLRRIFFMLNSNSCVILAAVLINFVCFVKAAIVFFDLSKIVLRKPSTAYKASILYCINPASIFFSAVYSESLYAYLTFYTMLRSIKLDPFVSFPLGLSILTRSNGMINIGFPVYFRLRHLFHSLVTKRTGYSLKTLYKFLFQVTTFKSCCSICNIIIISVAPFVLLQVYNYMTFCIVNSNVAHLPAQVLNYSVTNNLVLPGNGSKEWCGANIPLAYSYIQQKYWNVGFLNYYQLKQIPNFILAFPVLYIMVLCMRDYCFEHKKYFYTLGLSQDYRDQKGSEAKKYPSEMLPFVVHGLFLTVFCILFVHIQVSTRLLCSASPLIYWYCALNLSYAAQGNNDSTYENKKNLFSKWRVFFLTQKQYSLRDKITLSYFLGYLILGSFMFPNFLPWT